MILWTIQPLEVYELLINTGSYVCDKTKAETLNGDTSDDTFIKAYDWLVAQMDARGIPHPKGVEYPVWAWHTRDWKRKQPDLRRNEYGKRGETSVCLEIEVPDELVLLSDFDAWHYVLNEIYFDDSTCEEEWEKIQDDFDKLSFQEQKRLTKESWQKIFDITPIDTEWAVVGRYIQAVFWELKKENIRKVRFFTCK